MCDPRSSVASWEDTDTDTPPASWIHHLTESFNLWEDEGHCNGRRPSRGPSLLPHVSWLQIRTGLPGAVRRRLRNGTIPRMTPVLIVPAAVASVRGDFLLHVVHFRTDFPVTRAVHSSL